MNKPYKRPVISAVFESIGGAAFIAGLFALIAAFVDTSNGHSGAPGAIAGAVCMIMAALYIGIGQGIDFLGRASDRSEKLRSLLVEEILPQLKAMDARFAPSVAPLTPTAEFTPSVAPQPPTTETPPVVVLQPPEAEYFYSKDGKEEGPFSAAELEAFRAKGVIKETTPIFRTGDKDWLPFRKIPDLAKS
jgi:hypothetical protein